MLRLFTFLALLSSAGVAAQSAQFVDSIILSGLPLEVMVEDVTNTPIIAQQYSFVGLDQVSGDSLWSVPRNALFGIGQKLSEDGAGTDDIVDIPKVPFVFIRGVVVDVRDGNKLITEEEEAKLFRGSTIIDDLCLIEVAVKGGTRLYGLGAKDGSRRFAIDLKEKGSLSLTGNAAGDGGRKPMILDKDNIIYFDNKNMYRINIAKGEMLWSYEGKVKTVVPVDGGNKLALLFRPGGMLSLADYDKDFQLLDANTGAPAYKKPLKMDGNLRQVMDYDGGLAIIHSDGMNIYDFGAEKGRWKKGFKQNGIKEFKVEDGGLMVYFKNKRMLIDPASGDEKMKKAEKLDRPAWTGYEPKAVFTFAGKEVKVWGSNQIEIDGKKMNFSKIAMDEASGLIAMMTVREQGTSLKKGVYNYTIVTYNAKTGAEGGIDQGFNITSGVKHLSIVGNRIYAIGWNGRYVQTFNLEESLPEAGGLYNFRQLKRQGEGLRRLVGEKKETPESIPGYLTGDGMFYRAVTKEGFDPATYNTYKAKVIPLMGVPYTAKASVNVPTLAVLDIETGKVVMQDRLYYKNASVTHDKKQGLLYVIHGKSVRWYKF